MARKTESPLWKLIESERRALVADLADVDEVALSAASGLDDWTAKHVLAHVVMPFAVPTPRFLLALLRRRGDLHAVNRFFADRLVERPAAELIAYLSDNAASRWSPPGDGPELPLTEIAVHAQDIRAALGLSRIVPDQVLSVVLDYVGADKKDGAARRADHARRLDLGAQPTSQS
jgi:uncharacterized protein (TIGR03083 family)